MGHTIGRGRYKSETYPRPPANAQGTPKNMIVWRSDGRGTAVTYAEVLAQIAAAAPIPPTIICNQIGDNLTVTPPSGAFDNWRGARLIQGGTASSQPGFSAAVISFADGARVRNLVGCSGSLELDVDNSSSDPVLTFDFTLHAQFEVLDGAILLGINKSVFSVADGDDLTIIVDGVTSEAGRGNEGATDGLVSLADGGALDMIVTNGGSAFNAVQSASAGAIFNYQFDSSAIAGFVPGELPYNPLAFAGIYQSEILGQTAGAWPTVNLPSVSNKAGSIAYDMTTNKVVQLIGGAWIPL